MGKKNKPKAPKDKFDDLNPEFRENAKAMNSAEVRKRITDIALATISTIIASKNDFKLAEAKKVAKDLGAPYRDELKELKLQTEFLHQVLADRGEDVQSFERSLDG